MNRMKQIKLTTRQREILNAIRNGHVLRSKVVRVDRLCYGFVGANSVNAGVCKRLGELGLIEWHHAWGLYDDASLTPEGRAAVE